jgi:hypothetical protein
MPMLSYQGGHLCFEGKLVKRLSDDLGTPFFLISEARLKANYNALARGLSHSLVNASIRYCAGPQRRGDDRIQARRPPGLHPISESVGL